MNLYDILNKYNLTYDDLIQLLYSVSDLTGYNVENIVDELDKIENIDF